MAELALGGIELAVRPRTRPGQCVHEARLTIVAAGVERSICETCGHISVAFVSEVSGPVSREHFARPADEGMEREPAPINPFADEEKLGVRRREHADVSSLLLTA